MFFVFKKFLQILKLKKGFQNQIFDDVFVMDRY
jgi:hypothetical protein